MADSPLLNLPPDLQRLIEIVETSMHHIVRADMSREQAIEIRQRFSRPIGTLARKHGLQLPHEEPSENLVRQIIEENGLTFSPLRV